MASKTLNRSGAVAGGDSSGRIRYHARVADVMEKPLALEELQRALIERIYRYVMQIRFVIAPLPLIVMGIVLVFDHALWRRVAISTALPLAIALMLVEDRRVQREGIPDLKRVAIFLGAFLQPVGLVVTGGVLSPVILAMLLVDFAASTLLERRVSRTLVILQVVTIISAGLLEYSQILGSLIPEPFRAITGFTPSPVLLLVWVAIASMVFVGTREMGCRIQSAFAELLHRVLRTRDESLCLHREQLSELTLLSGEIAHELKNPLASIKGLSALLSRRSQGQEPEPLTVLRREVDRMQGILESFLNFSRPLVPLNVSPANLCAVASEVCTLHEGMSDEKGVEVELDMPGPVEVRCDPRKVRQILVNLLQNALDATAARGRIVIRVRATDECATIALEDDGVGLDPELSLRIFEAGVTSKPGGSGLGLSVARGLARQHGGDLTLANGPLRGCIATLRLPYIPKPLDASAVSTNGELQPMQSQQTREQP